MGPVPVDLELVHMAAKHCRDLRLVNPAYTTGFSRGKDSIRFLGHFGHSLEGFETAPCDRVRSERKRCYRPLDDLEGDQGHVARYQQNIGFVAPEHRLEGGERVGHAPC